MARTGNVRGAPADEEDAKENSDQSSCLSVRMMATHGPGMSQLEAGGARDIIMKAQIPLSNTTRTAQ